MHKWEIVVNREQDVDTSVSLMQIRDQHEQWIVAGLAERCSLLPADITLDQPFVDSGLDSLAAVERVSALKKRSAFSASVDITSLWDYPTVASLVEHICSPQHSDKSERKDKTDITAALVNDEVAKFMAMLESKPRMP